MLLIMIVIGWLELLICDRLCIVMKLLLIVNELLRVMFDVRFSRFLVLLMFVFLILRVEKVVIVIGIF